MPRTYDAIVIGTGQAGPPLAERMGREGLKVAVIERKLVGGTCVNTGCIPTKTLIGSARIAYMARRSESFGIRVEGGVTVDMKRTKARKDEIVGESNQGVTQWLEGMDNVDFIRGHARFAGDRVVEVNGDRLKAERIFINTGARARLPDWDGLDQVDYLTNSSMMDVDFLPEHLVIVGASYVGLEFAQMYRRFGSEVTVIETQARPVAREDEDISEAIREILEEEGIRFRFGAECVGVRRAGAGISVRVSCNDPPKAEIGSHVLIAIGRTPNSDDLGLESAGIETDDKGYIKVDEHLQTSAGNVWALGEVNGRGAFTHTAYNDFEIAAANLFDGDTRKVTDRIDCYGLFTDPPLGRAGMTEREVRKSGKTALIGKRDMSRVGRAREFGDTRGFMKILVDANTQEILGAALLGMSGDEAVHSLLDVMYARKPYSVISRAVHIHPTVSELLPTVLKDLKPLN